LKSRIRDRPEVLPEPQGLIEIRTTVMESIPSPEHLELGFAPARADPDDQPAMTEPIEGRQLLGQHDPVPLGDHNHRDAKPDLAGKGSNVGESQQRLEDLSIWTCLIRWQDHVVGRPDRGEAKSLRGLRYLDHTCDRCAGRIRRQHDSETHVFLLMRDD
jgi:hypothetical protein